MYSAFKPLALVAALSLACSAAFAEVKAKIGHAMPETHPQAAAMNKFAELVNTYTKGNVKVQAFHSAVLGSDEKQLQAVQAGTQELYIGTLAPLSARVKEVQVWDLPFLFANEKEVYAVLNGPSSKKIFQAIEPSALVGLTWTGMGFRNLSNSKRSVTKIDDINGLKVRVMTNPVALDTWKTLGANATPMAFAEVFPALDPADKEGVQKAATEAGALQRKLLDDGNADVIAKFKAAGVTVDAVPPAELAKIQDKVKPVMAKFAPQIGEDFVKGFQAEIATARAAK